MARKVRKAFLQNANINMARMVIEGAVSPPPEPANEAGGAKPQLNAGSLVLQDGVAHC